VSASGPAQSAKFSDLTVKAGDPPVEVGDQLVEVLAHPGDDDRPLQQGVALVARLGTHRQQPVAGHQPLPHLVVDRRRRGPGGRAQRRGELRQIRSVERVGLGPPQLRLGEVVRLARVDHRDPVARLVQGNREGDPVVARRFHHDERGARRAPRGPKPPLQGGEARRRLLPGDRRARLPAGRAPRRHERLGRHVDAHK
jgi:hypothetical protein